MKIDPFSSIPIGSLHKLNWFEGFKRIKRVLEIALILGAVAYAGLRYFSDPYVEMGRAKGGEKGFFMGGGSGFAPEELAKGGEWTVEWRGNLHLFPKDTTAKEIRKVFKKWEGTNFFSVFKDMILSILAGVALFELCFWIPVYIARGFGKPND